MERAEMFGCVKECVAKQALKDVWKTWWKISPTWKLLCWHESNLRHFSCYFSSFLFRSTFATASRFSFCAVLSLFSIYNKFVKHFRFSLLNIKHTHTYDYIDASPVVRSNWCFLSSKLSFPFTLSLVLLLLWIQIFSLSKMFSFFCGNFFSEHFLCSLSA